MLDDEIASQRSAGIHGSLLTDQLIFLLTNDPDHGIENRFSWLLGDSKVGDD